MIMFSFVEIWKKKSLGRHAYAEFMKIQAIFYSKMTNGEL